MTKNPPPDPGRIHYRIHNIYINFVETYDRLEAGTPITLGQKTLFVFWFSVIIFWLLFKISKLLCYVFDRNGGKLNEENSLLNDENSKVVNTNSTEIPGNTENSDGIFATISQKFQSICFSRDKDQPRFEDFLLRMMIFCAIMFYFWLCDYLRIWPKVEKQYSRDVFVFLFFLLVFVAFVFTVKKTSSDLLVRDQTEEWKGWMQVQFVWYHYWDAQEVFNSIRVYVGAYVWMTGYGNYMYFSKRKDYSIFRLMKMLFRLNFLVFCVMVVTQHEFVRYYICAMHTYWFLSVWVCMVVLNRYNKYPSFVIGKFAIYIAINALIFNVPGAMDKVFHPFRWALNDAKGTLHYWKFRSKLDHMSTIIGMIVAFNYERYSKFLEYLDKDEPKTKRFRETLRYGLTFVLVGVLITWIRFVLCKEKHEYLLLHPFLSPIPIVIYTWLRNMHPLLRSYHLNLFTWLGKITLETYLSQIHIYMIHSAQKILVYLPHYPLLNFALATIIYVFVSYVLFHLTVFFSSYILPRNGDVVIKNIFLGCLWLLFCYAIALTFTHMNVWSSKHSGLEFLRWNITKS